VRWGYNRGASVSFEYPLTITREDAGESVLRNKISALLKEQDHNFAERFNDSKLITKYLFLAIFYAFKPAKHLNAGKR